ncbi:MAG: virulence factor [Chloroflexota bacterium]
MTAFITVIWWRDIPAQVVAKDKRRSAKVVLHPRFQVAIDKAADTAGLRSYDVYLEEWRKEQRPCGDDLAAEAEAEATRLENDFPQPRLKTIIAAGGLDATRGRVPAPPRMADEA